MKAYVQFTETVDITFNRVIMEWVKCEPQEKDCIGSDGVFILDGRNSIDTMIEDAKDRAKKLKNIKPWISGFKIIKGDFNNGRVVATIKL